ncbi:hypothetical protein [Candidatus Regiella insecticola]|uniref:hypothetical protein n=1 Tax=Candidatus Regiella insecticola TaxID=138073 RepID=UPI001ED918A4|nr:hypothetical protein [Candidatus Regiella insecticola]
MGLTFSENRWKDISSKFFWKKDDILEISDGDISKIESLLNFLYPEVLLLAKDEKYAFVQYLEDIGFTSESNVAIIDIGYSGTIQKCLNRLVNKPVHGYYCATSHHVKHSMPLSAVTRGCYVEDGKQKFKDSRILSDSFILEKLLSSNELQIIRYFFNDEGVLDKELKIKTEKEKLALPVRNKLQSGVISYVEKATQVRNVFAPNFCPSLEIADALYRLFIENINNRENQIIKKLALDDDYCGRGVV